MFKVLKEKNWQPRLLNLTNLSTKTEGEVKTFPIEGMCYQENCSARNAKGSPFSWNERTLDNNSVPWEEIRISSKGKYLGKFLSSYYCNFGLYSTFCFLHDLRDECIKKLLIYVFGHTMYKEVILWHYYLKVLGMELYKIRVFLCY